MHFVSLMSIDLPDGFGGFVESSDNLLVLTTDEVGSKLQIATVVQTKRRVIFKRKRLDSRVA